MMIKKYLFCFNNFIRLFLFLCIIFGVFENKNNFNLKKIVKVINYCNLLYVILLDIYLFFFISL